MNRMFCFLIFLLSFLLYLSNSQAVDIDDIFDSDPKYQIFADSFNVDNWPNHFGPTRCPLDFRPTIEGSGLTIESIEASGHSARYRTSNGIRINTQHYSTTYYNQMRFFVNCVPPGDGFIGFDTTYIYWDVGFYNIDNIVASLSGLVDNYYIRLYSTEFTDSLQFCNLFSSMSQQIRNASILDSLEASTTIPRLVYFSIPDSFQQNWFFEPMPIYFLMNHQDEIFELEARIDSGTQTGRNSISLENITTNDTLDFYLQDVLTNIDSLYFSVRARNVRGERFDTSFYIYADD